ncbi:MAG TPA: DUF4350 domain-containing protein [Chloroflexia bacterium]|nr:DUF4350 domain-containing protein [Chloroflexia bacterium]
MSIEPSRQGTGTLGELAVLGVSVVVLFAGLIWLVGLQGTADTPESAGSSQSAGRRGTLALYRWLERSGFDVSRVVGGEQFPPRVDTLIMVNPNDDFPQGQAGSVRRWVEEGHTLILALGSRNGDLSTIIGGRHPMLRELGIDLDLSPGYSSTVPLSQPLFSRPPVSRIRMPGVFKLELPVRDTVVLASSSNEDGSRAHLAAMLKLGEGRVFVLASDYPLNNEGLREEDNGAFVYNMAQMAGGRRVAFDEAHHGQSVGGDLVALFTNNPWGWALIYGALLTGAYVFWSARRLGPPLPVRSPDQRRPTSDYVTSVADLFRRARKPGYAAERYLQFFKRTLSRHAALDPTLTDSRFVQSLSERGRHAFNMEDMLRAVERLRRLEGEATAGEGVELETLKAIREAERVRQEALGLRGDAENG